VRRENWIAANLLTVQTNLAMITGILEDHCSCAVMDAKFGEGHSIVYKWPIGASKEKVSAMEYTDRLNDALEELLSDRDLIPLDGSPFPRDFESRVATLMKRVFRLFAHTFLSHFQAVSQEEAEAHVRFCYKHFLFFVKEFNLVDDSDMVPLQALNEKILEAAASLKSES
jgi:MOB kinase activator 1